MNFDKIDTNTPQSTEDILKSLAKLGIGQSKRTSKKPKNETQEITQQTKQKSIEDIDTDESDDEEEEDIILEKDLDLKSLDELTKRLAKDLGTDFLGDSDEEDTSEDEEISDEQFKMQLMEEFRKLKPDLTSSAVPKQRLKELYIQLLKSGHSIMKDKTASDQFLSKLDAKELSELMNILQMDPEDTIKYFNNDPQVIEVIKTTPGISSIGSEEGKELWDQLNEEDFTDDTDEDFEKKRANASDDVKKVLKIFEENLLHYTQNPQEILQLSEKLNPKDQEIFLDILFHDYSPNKIKKQLGLGEEEKKKEKVEKKKEITDLNEIIDAELVASVFREVFTHFRAYKRQPQRFKALTDHLNPLEKQAFDALVKTFWDLSVDKIKI